MRLKTETKKLVHSLIMYWVKWLLESHHPGPSLRLYSGNGFSLDNATFRPAASTATSERWWLRESLSSESRAWDQRPSGIRHCILLPMCIPRLLRAHARSETAHPSPRLGNPRCIGRQERSQPDPGISR